MFTLPTWLILFTFRLSLSSHSGWSESGCMWTLSLLSSQVVGESLVLHADLRQPSVEHHVAVFLIAGAIAFFLLPFIMFLAVSFGSSVPWDLAMCLPSCSVLMETWPRKSHLWRCYSWSSNLSSLLLNHCMVLECLIGCFVFKWLFPCA